jgi:hypothetical protein
VKLNDDKPGPNPLVLAIAAIGCLAFGINEIVQRMNIEVDGVVVSSQTTTGNRPVTIYLIRGSDGREHEHVAGPTDKSLPRRLPEGTYLKKKKYELSYIKNGEVMNDFPLFFYLTACGLGVLIGWWSYSQWRFNQAFAKTLNERLPRTRIS